MKSLEPGYYEDEKFGIRLENIEVVVKANTPYNYKNRGFLTFLTVTLMPVQTKLLDLSLLADSEVCAPFLSRDSFSSLTIVKC